MSTNYVQLRTIEQFMAGYTPRYSPLYPLVMDRAIQYPLDAGKINFNRVETVGDIRAKRFGAKDNIMEQVAAKVGSKTFKKYYMANQFAISHLQNQEGVEQVLAEVLDEHQKQFDDLLLLGEGTSASTMINNGLFWSDDPNYVVNSSVEVDSTDRLLDFHNDVLVTVTQADLVAGRKLLIFYGSNILPLYNSLHVAAAQPVKSVLQQVIGPDYTTMALPSSITPASSHGWLIVNRDQIAVHYTRVPGIDSQGSDDRAKEYWFNFLMGSVMVECLAPGAIIKQAATLE